MKRLWFSLFLLTSFVFSSLAFGQAVIGTSSIDGRPVEILSDKTWRFVQRASAAKCSNLLSVSDAVQFCNSGNWKVMPKQPPINVLLAIDDRHYAAFISEAIGSEDGVSTDFMVKTAHGYLAAQMNIPVESLEVLYTRDKKIDGKQGAQTAYAGNIDGLKVTYINSIYVGQNNTVQVVTWGVGKMKPELKVHHETMVQRTILN